MRDNKTPHAPVLIILYRMALPELDLARIHRWCDSLVPEDIWHELKIEADEAPRHVTIVEVRPPWDGVGEHTRQPVARLRYTMTTGLWSLYWCDQNSKFHEYDIEPTPHVDVLLHYIEHSGDPIFFG